MLNEQLINKWKPILEHEDLGAIKDVHRRNVTAVILENTERELRKSQAYMGGTHLLSEANPIPANAMRASSSTAGDGSIDTFDPILISLVRRSMPNLMAYDICGVQPMTGPTGLIFAMRARYANQTYNETFYPEVDTTWSSIALGNSSVNDPGMRHVGNVPGNTTQTINLASTNTYNYVAGMSRAQGEALGTSGNAAFAEMAFSIEKLGVEAKTRALKAEYTMELAQDLKAVHGLDAETELSNILTSEILAEINREVVRTIFVVAKQGAATGTTTAGVFDLDTDSNGRWLVEKFKGMMFQIEREMNQIAKETRRGKGNIIICSSNVASALQMAGILDYTPALNGNNGLTVDDTGNTFVGLLHGKIRVYIDPYAGGDFMVAGYKGSSAFDAGLFYCPYVPLQMVRAVDQDSFHPKIGFKTRYGMVAHPFAQGLTATTAGTDGIVKDSNVYYRRLIISNLM